MVFLGVDWAEEHHDICLLDEQGNVLGRARVANSLEGVSHVHALVADHAEEPAEVMVGIETDRGLLVQALLAAGYKIYAINPLAVDRYRDRHSVSGAKSDAADAKVLADLVRTDRRNHRPVAGDSHQVEAVKLLARAHQALVHTRQRQVNQLRSTCASSIQLPSKPSKMIWVVAMRWPFWSTHRLRPELDPSPRQSSSRRSGKPDASATWKRGQLSCKASFASLTWSSRPRWSRPMDSSSSPASR